MSELIYRTAAIAQKYYLSPSLFFKKAWARVLLKTNPSIKGEAQTKIGDHTIVTLPSRNDWWKSIYLGCCDVEITHNIKRYLSESGVFIDVGGGVGYFSAVASEIAGSSGQIHCFEPNPANITAIQKMIQSNPGSNIILNGYALGVDEATHYYHIKRLENSTDVTMVDNLINPEEVSETLEVKTQRLDKYLEQKKIKEVSLIKIDVEGFEFLVLKGMEDYFKKNANRPPIICEISPLACSHLGYTLSEFHNYMCGYGYQAYNIFNTNRIIDIRTICDITDVVFR